MDFSQRNYLTCCLVIFAALSCSGRESAGSGDDNGSGVEYCSAPATEYMGCADGDRVERFHFSVEENRCKSYTTCPPEDPLTESNFFVSLQDCETACPPKKLCTAPSYPANGMYRRHDSVEDGELVQRLNYSCSHGYHLVGPRVRECMDGVWSGEEPTCQQTTCPDLEAPAGEGILNMHKLCSGLQTPDCLVVYTCVKYPLVYGTPLRKCEADGTWSGEQPYCGKLVIKHDGQEVEAISIPDGNENLEIDCIMVPHFPPGLLSNVQWLPGNRNTSWTTDNSSFQLKFHRVHLTDTGDYKCEVFGDNKKMERKIAIKVKEVKEEVADGWKPNLMLAHIWPQSNQLLCAFESSPKAHVSWYINGTLLSTTNDHYKFTDASEHHPTFTMATLEIKNPTESDYSAVYQCVGANSLGEVKSPELTFQQSPRKRSASSNEDSAFSLKTFCSPDIVPFLGKVRRKVEQSRGSPILYHISVDKALIASRPVSQTVIKATSDSAMDVQRHQPYIFVTQRTDDDKYTLNTVLPYVDNLDTVLSQLCS